MYAGPIETLRQVIDVVVAHVPRDSRAPAAGRSALAEVEAVVAAARKARQFIDDEVAGYDIEAEEATGLDAALTPFKEEKTDAS